MGPADPEPPEFPPPDVVDIVDVLLDVEPELVTPVQRSAFGGGAVVDVAPSITDGPTWLPTHPGGMDWATASGA